MSLREQHGLSPGHLWFRSQLCCAYTEATQAAAARRFENLVILKLCFLSQDSGRAREEGVSHNRPNLTSVEGLQTVKQLEWTRNRTIQVQ